MEHLQEAIGTFDNWIDDNRLNAAVIKWQPKRKTQEGQKEILKAAASGDATAADFLFLTYTKLISRAFWKYYIGPDKRYSRVKLANQEDKEFASVAYTILLGKEKPNPHKSFNPDVFDKDADLIKQFGYYFYNYLGNYSRKTYRKAAAAGLTGRPQNEEIRVVSYDRLGGSLSDPDQHSFEDEVVLEHSLKQYVQLLKDTNEKFYDIFMLRAKGKTVDEVAEILGFTRQSIRLNLITMKEIYDDFMGG